MFIIFHFGLNASGKSLLSSPKIQSMTVSLFFFIPPSQIHGCVDGYSRKVMWLEVSHAPLLIIPLLRHSGRPADHG